MTLLKFTFARDVKSKAKAKALKFMVVAIYVLWIAV